MLRKLWLPLLLVAVSLASAQETRHFTFHYGFTVKNVPAGERVRVWIPAAHSDEFQEVKVISAGGDLGLKKTHESRFGNEMYYADVSKAKQADLHFEVVYDVVRHERLTLGIARPRLAEVQLKDRDRKEYLQPDKLVPVTGLPADLAVKVTEGKATPLEKARAIYDYVFTTMRYDKTGTGWGHGDVLYACDAKKGNCTDFHSLFIAMAGSQAIPARFEIGFPLPRTSIRPKSPVIIAGPISSNPKWMDSGGHLRSLEASGKTRLFLWSARCEQGAVQHGARSTFKSGAGWRAFELFRVPVRGSGGQGASQCVAGVFVCGRGCGSAAAK